jgi:hypothetical protein
MLDQHFMCSALVVCDLQVIGVVVAETEPLARRAAKAVKVTYEDLPAIISIEDAIAAGSYYDKYHGDALQTGDLEAGFAGGCARIQTREGGVAQRWMAGKQHKELGHSNKQPHWQPAVCNRLLDASTGGAYCTWAKPQLGLRREPITVAATSFVFVVSHVILLC